MKQKFTDNKGFTLLEMTMVLLLMGIIGSIWGLGIIQIVDGFLLSKNNTETAQKGQMAMTRLVKELQSIEHIFTTVPPIPQIKKYISYSRDAAKTDPHSISFFDSANQVTIDGDILTDSVNDFSMIYYEKFDTPTSDGKFSPTATMLKLKLSLDSGSGIVSEFETFVFLRGLI